MKILATLVVAMALMTVLGATPARAMDTGLQLFEQPSILWSSNTDWKKYYKAKKYKAGKKYKTIIAKKKAWKKKHWKKKKKPVPVPEPSVLALLGAGLIGVVLMRRRVH